jgi:Flp pilus assembly protein TadG
LIEFAFVMPVTLLLLLGIIDFGRAYVASIALEGAAREGARLAIDSSQTDAAVLARTEQSAQPMVLTTSNISLCTAAIVPPAYPPPCAATGQMDPRDGSTSGKAVTVTVHTFVPFFTAFLTQRLGFSGIPVEASDSMQAW